MVRYAPDLLEELRGVSDGSGIPYEPLLTSMLTIPYVDVLRGCTVIAVTPERTREGEPIVGRNYDFFHDVSEDNATTYICYPHGRYASVGNCDIFVGREDGLNEKGLFAAMAAFFYPGLAPGLTFWFIIRLILDRCATVEEGVELLKKLPHASSYTYLLADALGKAVVAEPTVEGMEFRYPRNGLLMMTNHAICERWAGKEKFVPQDSRPRYESIERLLGRGQSVGREDMKKTLGDHEGFICSHGHHFPERKFGTLWSVVGCPGERQLEIAGGHPCRVEYRKVKF
jgi:predicted choloylglycine hydrolase